MRIILKLQHKVDAGLAMNADEFRAIFMSGIPIESFQKYQIRNEQIEQIIKQNQALIENDLEIRISKQIIEESRDYERRRFHEWGYISVFYNINAIIKIEGRLNESKVSTIDINLINFKKQIDQFRNIYFVAPNFATLFYNSSMLYLYMTSEFIPNFWFFRYVSGFNEIPEDLFDFVGKKALYNLYNLIGNILLPFGVTSSSKSIDGLSQSTSLTRSASSHLFSAAQKQLMDEFQYSLPILRTKYRGIAVMRM